MFLSLFLVLIFMSGCPAMVRGGATPEETESIAGQVRSGVQGLEIQFAPNLPPSTLYDLVDLIVVAELNNRGAYDIRADQCFVELGGFSSSIIRGINYRQSCGDIVGKSLYNAEGGFNRLEFKSSNIVLPRGVDTYKPPLVLTACYKYQTTASPQVCVDPSFYQLTAEQKACQVRDISLGGGQGAPVSIENIKVNMVGRKVIFEIDVSNGGGGRVVSPLASLSRCPSGLRYDDFDLVRFNVDLVGGSLVKCTPQDQMIRMTDGRGKIFCTFEVGNTQAYETPLKVELDYKYMQSISKQIEIIKTPE